MDTIREVTANAQSQSASLPAIAGGRQAKTTPYTRELRYGDDELKELQEALAQGSLFFAHGAKVRQLEAEYAAYAGAAHAIATSSGTATIHAALMAAGVSPGDEVIVPPITDMGSIVPILFQGAIPVFADIEFGSANLDPSSVEKNITDKTRAILVVHLAGIAANMDAIKQIADERKIAIIEDCAQAHGCTYDGVMVGNLGIAGCYSLNEFKHISCGDGGVVVTNDARFAQRCRLSIDKAYTRDFGKARRSPSFLANNYRMTELQAAVARAQLRKLDSIVSRRRVWCGELSQRLSGIRGLHLPEVTPRCDPSWWFYLMRIDPEVLNASADRVTEALRAEGMPVTAHYIGEPIYQYPLFVNHSAFDHADHPFVARQYGKGLCPNAERILDTCIMLSVNEAYSAKDLSETVNAFEKVFNWFASQRRMAVAAT